MRKYASQERDFDNIDGSSPLFSMYLKVSDAEDEKMASGWRADADGILVFVSGNVTYELLIAKRNADWFIFCCSRGIFIHITYRPPTRTPRISSRSSRRHPSGPHRHQKVQSRNPSQPRYIIRILPAQFRYLGQRTLVLEPGSESDLCTSCNLDSTVGTQIRQDYSVAIRSA
jgi:hypothetical protein